MGIMDGYTLAHKLPSRKDFVDTADFDQSEILDIIRTSRTVCCGSAWQSRLGVVC